MKARLLRAVMTAVFLVLFVAIGHSATYTSSQSGPWNVASTWGGAGFPVAGDIVNISNSHTISVTADAACATINFPNGNANNTTLQISPGITLTVSGLITIPMAADPAVNKLAVGAGTLNAGSIAFTNGGEDQRHIVTISTGTVVVGNVTQTGSLGSATINITGAGQLELGGTFLDSSNGTMTFAVGSTVNYNAAGDQTIGDFGYSNLTLSGSGTKTFLEESTVGGNLTLTGTATATTVESFTIGGNLDVGNGTSFATGASDPWTLNVTGTTSISGTLTLSNNAVKTFTGDVTINATGIWNETGIAPINFGGDLIYNGTLFTPSTGLHTFTGVGRTIGGIHTITIPDITFTGNYTNTTVLSCSNVLTVTGAAVRLTNNNNIMAGTDLTGTGGIINNAVLNIGNTITINTAILNNLYSLVAYIRAGNQTIRNTVYYSLTFMNGGIKTATAGLTILGDLTINSGVTFDGGGFTHNIGGIWTNDGTFTSAGSTVNFNGTASQSIVSGGTGAGKIFNNLTINNAAGVTMNVNNVNVSGILILTNGPLFTGANTLMVTNNAVGAIVRTNGHVVGNLQRAIAGAGNLTYAYDLGTATSYTPVSVAFTALATGGTLTASATPGQDPNVGSPVSKTNNVATYWTFTNNGITFDNYNATFTYNGADIIGGGFQSRFIVGKYSPPWSAPTPVVNAGSGPYTTHVSGLTSFSDFVIGDAFCDVFLTSAAGTDHQSVCVNSPITNITYSTTDATGASFSGLPAGVNGSWAANVVTISGTPTTTVGSPFNYQVTLDCGSIVTGTITVDPVPVPTISGSTIICEGSTGYVYTTQAGMSNYIWNVSAEGTIASGGGSGDNTVTIDWNTAGAATVSVNYRNGNNCTAAAPTVYPVSVNPRPVPSISGPAPACMTSGNVYSTASGKLSYAWFVSSGGIITAGGGPNDNTVTVTWTLPGNESVGVNYQSLDGCWAVTPTNLPVVVNTLPVPTITGPSLLCNGSTGNIYTTESGMTGYSWIVSGGTITAGAGTNAITVTWTSAGVQSVSVNYTNANGCMANTPTSYVVIVTALPTPTITGPNNLCVGTTGNVYTTETLMTGYIWTVSAGGVITAGAGTNSITVNWNTSGSKTVTVTYTDAFGCSAAAPTIYPVSIDPLPVPSISGSASVCINTTGHVYTTESGMTNYIWVVSAGGTITAGGGTGNNTVTVTWTTLGPKTVSVSYTNNNGCTAAAPTVYNVTVNPLPVPTLSGPTPVCVTFPGNVYTTEAGMTNYVWSVSAGGTVTAGGNASSNTVTVTWTTTGPKTVSVNYNNGNGCTAVSPTVYNITVNPIPAPTLAGPANVCAGTTGNVYTTEAGMNNYTWTVSPGGSITAGGGAGNNTVTVTWNTAGAQTVSVNYANASNCTALTPTVRNVTVNALPVPTIAGPASPCVISGGNVYMTEFGMSNYTWVVSAGGTITAGGGVSNNTVTVTWNTAGAQTVTVNYTNGSGCTATAPTVYNVSVIARPVPTITQTPPSLIGNSVCNGYTYTYTTEPGQFNYSWTVSPGGTILAGGTFVDDYATVQWNNLGPQSVSTNYINANGCTATTMTVHIVNVTPIPVPVIIGPSPVCQGSTGNVYLTAGGMTNYTWTVSSGGTITSGAGTSSITVTWNSTGAQNVTVSYITPAGCSTVSPTVYNVLVNPAPVPTITGPTPVCQNSTGNVYTTQAGMSSYSWAVSAGGTINAGGTATDHTVTVTWNTAGPQTVSVNYTNGSSCSAGSPTVYNVNVNALPVPSCIGPNQVCQGSTGIIYVTEGGMSNYTWLVSAGGTVTSGGATTDPFVVVTWNTSGSQTVSVNYTDGNGCTAAAPTVNNVTVHALPVPTIAGPTPVCATSTGNTYTTQAGMTGYTWSVSAGGSVTAGGTATDDFITVTWNTAGPQTVSVNYTDGNGCTASSPTVYNVTVNPLPAPTISGPTPVCQNSTGNVYTTEAGKSNYIWVVSAGGTITAGGGLADNTVTVTWNTPGAQTVRVNYTNAFGCTATAPFIYNVTVNALPAPTIAGPTPVCVNSSGNVYTTQAGNSNYLWTVSAGGTITAGGGLANNTVTVTWNVTGPQTVSVNYTNAAGCTAAAPTVYNITVNPLPNPTIAGPTPVCATSTGNTYTTQAGMTGYSWTVSAGGTVTAGGTATDDFVTVTWNTPGAQTVRVNYTNGNGCTASAPTVYNVTVNPLPVPTIAGPTPVCEASAGNVYTTESGMSNYTWIVSAGGTITAGGTTADHTVTVTWNTPGPQTVRVNYTNGNGCTATSPTVYNVTVNALPVPSIAGPTPVCVNSTGNVYTTQAGNSNYLWVVSAGGTITAGGGLANNTVTVTWNVAGPQTVRVNYTNPAGCTAAAPTVYNVTVNALPVPTIAGPTPVCVTSTGNVYSTQAGMTGYTWAISAGGTITAGGTATDDFVTVTWNTAGAQTVSVNYTNGNGCTAASPTVYNVTVNPLPAPTISGPTPVCQNSTGNVYTTQAGNSNYLWVVSAGGTITAGGGLANNTVTVTWNVAGPQTVRVNYTNGNGCTATNPTIYNVTVNPLPAPTISGPAAVCKASAGNVYNTESGMSGYIWTVSAGGTITAGAGTDAITVTWNTPGNQTITVNYTDGNGCTAAGATVYFVTVNDLPVPTIGGPTSVCEASAGNIYNTEAGMSGYIWTVSAGGTITAGGTATDDFVTVTWNVAGAETVSVSYTDGNGCTAAAPTVYNVTVNALPVPTISGPTPVCIQSGGNVYSTQSGMSGYTWVVSAGGTITSGGTVTDDYVTVTWNTSGSETVSVNYTDNNGCTASSPSVYNVTINPLPTPTISGPTPVCMNSVGNIYTTEAGMSGYLWTVSAGGTITAGGTINDDFVTVTWNTAGVESVSVNYTDGNGCMATDPTPYFVIINALPVPTISGPTPVCQNSTGNVYSTEAGMSGYNWTVSAGGTITAGNGTNAITVTWNNAGAQTVTVNYVDLNGCTAAAASSFPVTVNPPPVATATPSSQSICSGNPITTIALTSNPPSTDAITNGGFETGSFAPWVILSANPLPVVTNASAHSGTSSAFLGSQVGETPGDAIIYQTITVPAAGGTLSYWYQPNTTDDIIFDWQDAYIMDNTGNWLVTIMHVCTNAGWTNVTYDMSAFAGQTVRVEFLVHGDNFGDPTNMYVDDVTMLSPATFSWTRDNVATAIGIPASGAGDISGNLTNLTASPVNVTFTITPDAGGCVGAPITATVLVNPLPVPTITGPASVCQNSTGNVYTTEAGMSGYTWTVSAGGTITAGGGAGNNTVTVTWNTLGAQTVSVNYTDENGCTATAPTVYNVTVNALPSPTIAGPTPVCAGSTGNVYTTQAGMSGYTWAVSAGGTITGGAGTNAVTVTWNTAGAQTVSVNYTNAAGCTAAAPTVYNVTVNALPVPTIAGPTPVCAGSTGNVYSTQAGMSGYTWSVSAGGTITGGAGTNAITVTWNTAGAQTVSVNYTNGAGCTAPAPTVYNVTVNPLPVPTISGPASVCQNSTGNVYTTEAGMSGYIWTVSAGGTITAGGGAGNNSVTVTWNTVGAQTVSVNYTNGNGCTATSPTVYNVTVNALPAPTIAGPTPVCAGSTGNVYTTQAGMSGYTWAVSAGGTITGGAGTNAITVTWNTAGAQTVSVNYTNAAGCTAASPTVYNVTVNALPVPTIVGPTPVCATSAGNVYTTEAGMAGYIWNISAGGVITAGSGTNAITVTWNTAGAQTVSVNYTNGAGCTASAPTVYNVTVNPLPVPTIAGPTPVCAGSTGNVYTTQSGNSNYLWTVSAGGTITAGGGLANNTVTVTWNLTGPQTVSVNYTNTFGCTAAAPFVYNVTVNALPAPTIAGPTPVCAGSTGNVYTTQAGMSGYTWAVSAGGTIIGGAGTNTITVTWNTAGAQTVSVNYTNAAGCTAASPTVYNVTVNALPVPTIVGPTPVCATSAGNVYTTEAGMSGYIWNVTAGGVITAGSGTNAITVTWNTAGAQTVSVNYTNGAGCTAPSPTVYNVTVNPLPVPTIAGPGSVCVTSTGNVYTTQAGNSNYLWVVSAGGTITAGGGLADNTVTVTWNVTGPQTVRVNYTNTFGCTAAAPFVYNVTVNALPVPTISGPTPVCEASTGNVYTTEAGMSAYLWTVSAGGTITAGSGTNSITVTWNTAGAQTVSVNYTDANGCTGAAPTVYNVIVNALPVPTLSGPTPICAGTAGNVYTTEAGMGNYIWVVSAGGTITAGGTLTDDFVTVTWNTAGPQTVSVNYTNAAGCTAASPTVFNIMVDAMPVPTISGSASICGIPSPGHVYSTEAGITAYTWTVSAGGTITAGGTPTDNTVTVTWNVFGPQTVSVNYTNAAGCRALSPTVFNVSVNPIPVPTVSGPGLVCNESTGNVYTTEAGKLGYSWTVTGGTITGGANSNAITVTWNVPGIQSVSVIYMDPSGCTSPVPGSMMVIVIPLPTPTISGPNNVCEASTGNVYTTESGMTGYTWAISAGGTITAGGTPTDNSITVTWNTPGPQTVSVAYTNAFGCTPAAPTVYNVTVNPRPVPVILGPASVCLNSTGNVYFTNGGNSNYIWVVSAGGTITAGGGIGNNTVTVTWNTVGPQTVSVSYTSPSGCTTAVPTVYNVTVNPLPVPTLSGPTPVCVNTAGNVYTTEAGMSNYVWNVSAGGTITAGGTAINNTVTVTWNFAGAQTVSVNYTNAGGCSAPSPVVYNVTVTALNTIALTSAPGTNAQTVCINTPITNITYSTTGATGATFSGLPAGVNGVWAANVVTISGTPTVSGPFNYTVTLTGGCGVVTANGTITVNPNNTINLTSAPGTNAQTVCINTPITNITYATTGATGATFSGLPAGVNGVWAANVVTISGTPTVSGPFSYTVTLTGGCSVVTANGTITVNPNSTIVLTSAPGTNAQTVCINTPIVNITYATTVATGATFSGLPAGVNGVWAANVVTISGTPTVSGPFSYTVTLTGGCGVATANGTITVTPANTITLTSAPSTTAQTVCINTPIANITYSTTGATGATFSGLPAGVNGVWAANVVTISGTPTVSGPFSYTVTLTGGCGVVTANGTITVNPNSTIVLTSAPGTNAQTVCINTPIVNITYATTVATGATFSGLPAGVNGVWAANVVTISGTPTVSGPFSYTVTLTGGCGVATANGTITVTPANTITLTSAPSTTAQTVCINTPIANITYSTTGATGATFSGLPAGVNGVWAANVVTISGTPTVSGPFSYTVTLTGGCGLVTANGTITVTPNNTITLTSAPGTNAQTVCINTAITNITYSTTGATGATFSGLPTGVNGVWAANVVTISGIPTVSGPFSYTVTLTGGCGVATANGTITVNPNNTITLTSAPATTAQTVCINTPIANITYSTTGATGATFSGLPAGVNGVWAANVVTISGTPTVSGPFSYTVTLTGGCGLVTANGTITVNPANTIVLTSVPGSNAQTVCINTAITPITYLTTGATGATFSGLPAGVNGVWAANVVTISGTPTVSGPFSYTVTLTGGCAVVTANGTITVNPNNTITLTSAPGTTSQTVCVNTPIINITYATTGATGATVTGLPTGVTGVWAANVVTISGTPTISGPFSYTVTLTGGCGVVTAVGTITVIPPAGIPVFVLGPTSTRCQGPDIVTYTANSTNSTSITYSLDAASLAAGITINAATGAVTYTAGWVGVSMITATATGCGAPVSSFHLATTNPRPGPSIAGPSSVCAASCGNVYTTEAGMAGYVWTVSAGGTITAGAGTSSITVCWNTAGAQSVSVNYTNGFGCPALVPTVYNVTVHALPVPTIAGPATVCANSTGNVYTTQTGMSGYTWAVSAGGLITGGAGTNTITVTWNTAGAQTVSVNYTNANGCTAVAPTVFNVTVNAIPVPTITGATSMCVNSGYYNYTTEAGMLNYVWTVSSGGLINYGSGTNQIQVSWIAGGAQTVSVTYSNGTGCNAAAPTVLNVAVTPMPDQAGSITGSPVVCAGSNGVAYSVAPINGAATYVWTLPPNATIASGSGTNSITVDFGPNATSGNITVYGNNLCGNGGMSPLYPVTVNALPNPAGTISGPADVCEGATGIVYTVAAITNATGYSWSVPAGATIVSGGNTNSITVNFAMGASSGIITVAGTNSCGDGTISPDFALTVNPVPAPPVVTNIGYILHSSAPLGNQWWYSATQAGAGAPIAGATAQTYDATLTGTGYYWSIVTLNGCSSDTSNHKLVITTGIDPHPSAVINIYPVPNDGQFNVSIITSSEESYSIKIYNNLGVMIYEESKIDVDGTLVKKIDLRPAPNGVYTVVLESNQKVVIRKIVINK